MNEMIVKLINKGISEYEAKVFYHLIHQDKQAAQTIAQSCDIPRTKIYVVLDRLRKKGMIYETKGKTSLYSAVHPIDALNNIVGNLKHQYEEAQEIARDLAQIYSEREFAKNEYDEVELLHTPNLIQERILKYTMETSIEVLSMEKPPYSVVGHEKRDVNVLVPMRSIVQCSELDLNDDVCNQIFQEHKAGKICRVLDDIPLKFIVFDQKCVFLPGQDLNSNVNVMILRNPDIVKYYIETFNMYFDRAKPLDLYMNERNQRRLQ